MPQHWPVHNQVLKMMTPPRGSTPLTSHHTRHDHQTTSSSTITLSCHLDHSNCLSTAPSVQPPLSSRWCDLITPCLGTLAGSYCSENEAQSLTVAFKDLHLLAPTSIITSLPPTILLSILPGATLLPASKSVYPPASCSSTLHLVNSYFSL